MVNKSTSKLETGFSTLRRIDAKKEQLGHLLPNAAHEVMNDLALPLIR